MAVILIGLDCVNSWHMSVQNKMYKMCSAARMNAYTFANLNGYVYVPGNMTFVPDMMTNDTNGDPMYGQMIMDMKTGEPMLDMQCNTTMYYGMGVNQTTCDPNMPMAMYTMNDWQMEETMWMYTMCPTTDVMPNVGMIRDWLAMCWAGSLTMFFGTLWLYKEMILLAFILEMVCLPGYTAATLYLYYRQPMGNVFWTWWYASIVMFQFLVGLAAMYQYAWLKYELEVRAREEEIKLVQGKMYFPRDCQSIRAYPCMCKLWDKDKDSVIKRYDNMHQIDIRANILCPQCKNRVELILM